MKNIYYVDDSGVMRIERRREKSVTVDGRATFLHPLPLLLLLLAAIFVAELLVSVAARALGLDLGSLWPGAVVDALLLLLILLPVLVVFVYRPQAAYIRQWIDAIADRKTAEARFQDVADNAQEWIWEVDAQGRFGYVSPVVRRILGYEPQEMSEMSFFDRVHPDDREDFKIEVFRLFAKKKPFQGLIHRNLHRDGHAVWVSSSGTPMLDEAGELLGYRGLESDISELKVMEQQLKEAVLSDDLTGLLNRRGFQAFAEYQVKVAQRNGWGMALLFVDIDDLASINEEFGHVEGDQAVCDLATLFQRVFRKSDVIARLGGDEFAVLMMTPREQAPGQKVMAHLEETLRNFNEQGVRKYHLSASSGIATCTPGQDCGPEALLSEAKKALYAQKRESIPQTVVQTRTRPPRG